MTPFDIARSYLGTTEGPGIEDNPAILEMYASIGQDWVEHDDVAWCAAFVGHCLERAGIKSTRRLTARSYLSWGIPVDVFDAQHGDIGIISRGSASWQGHVFFIDRIEGNWVFGLGGNQSDAVNIKRYPVAKLLGVRRAGQVDPVVSLSVRDVQSNLRALGYHEVGTIDGILGPRTRAAILAFRDVHAMPLVPVIDVALEEALATASPRVIDPMRSEGAPEASRILRAAHGQMGLGALGLVGALSAQAGSALDRLEEVQTVAQRGLRVFGIESGFAPIVPWLSALLFAAMLILAWRARQARLDDHRRGKTL
jgi:uncharacterized protein (TIGR02594 family)